MPVLLLDLDNTVADRDAAFGHWMKTCLPLGAAARRYVIECDADGATSRLEFLSAVRSRFGLSASVDELLEEYRRATLEGFPGVENAVLAALDGLRARGWKLAIVTNGEAGVQDATVRRIGLEPLIDACVVSEAVGLRKPDPRIFALAAQRSGAPDLGGAWMIGDGEVDVLGAAAAGIRSVWLARGREWARTDVRPTAVAGSLLEALRVVADA